MSYSELNRINARVAAYASFREFESMERGRLAYLNQPPPPNPPALLKPTRVRVIRAFFIRADLIAQPGEVIDLPRHDALSLRATKKVEFL